MVSFGRGSPLSQWAVSTAAALEARRPRKLATACEFFWAANSGPDAASAIGAARALKNLEASVDISPLWEAADRATVFRKTERAIDQVAELGFVPFAVSKTGREWSFAKR